MVGRALNYCVRSPATLLEKSHGQSIWKGRGTETTGKEREAWPPQVPGWTQPPANLPTNAAAWVTTSKNSRRTIQLSPTQIAELWAITIRLLFQATIFGMSCYIAIGNNNNNNNKNPKVAAAWWNKRIYQSIRGPGWRSHLRFLGANFPNSGPAVSISSLPSLLNTLQYSIHPL